MRIVLYWSSAWGQGGCEASLVLVKCLGTRLVGLGVRLVLCWSSAWGQGEQVQDFLVFAGMTIQISTCEHGQLLWYTRVAYCRFVSHAVHICYMLYITYCTHVCDILYTCITYCTHRWTYCTPVTTSRKPLRVQGRA